MLINWGSWTPAVLFITRAAQLSASRYCPGHVIGGGVVGPCVRIGRFIVLIFLQLALIPGRHALGIASLA